MSNCSARVSSTDWERIKTQQKFVPGEHLFCWRFQTRASLVQRRIERRQNMWKEFLFTFSTMVNAPNIISSRHCQFSGSNQIQLGHGRNKTSAQFKKYSCKATCTITCHVFAMVEAMMTHLIILHLEFCHFSVSIFNLPGQRKTRAPIGLPAGASTLAELLELL